jgi:glycosyltransferase involved in cell wall biosynthesis
MKVAIVHDYLNQRGGAERVLECFIDLFPNAPIYTIISDLSIMPDKIRNADVRHSFIQSIPFSKKHYKKLIKWFPLAVEQFDLREYDVVLSSSSAFAKGVITNPNQLHICYCYTPMRYVWDLYHQYINEDVTNPIFKFLLPQVLHHIRIWDQVSAQRVDHYIADSNSIANRINKYYRREASVIYPPVNLDRFSIPQESEDFFLIVSRLIPYKRVDLAIQACNDLKLPLVIIGDGYDRSRLEAMAGPTVRMLGYQDDTTTTEYYRRCRAFILPGEEDFGITPLEAQACGKPVIAYGKGGALETVVDGSTGLFFNGSSVDSLKDALSRFNPNSFDPHRCRQQAMKFSEEGFKTQILSEINLHLNI